VLNHVIAASKQVGSIIKKNSMVILRSTIPIGTTRNTIKPIIEEISGLVVGKDFSLIFAPERTIEGAALSELKSNPQIIGSLTTDGIEKSSILFMKPTPTIVPVSNLETAEMIKLIDNTYRDVHFAFSNELALICENLNLNVYECIQKGN
jgi:UDP-N-acetyl-D-mannosaminuronic acid dehydrogenase